MWAGVRNATRIVTGIAKLINPDGPRIGCAGKEPKMNEKWKSIGLYEHPSEHRAGTWGNVVLSHIGVYCLRVGSSIMSCPQEWGTKIHKDEGDEKQAAIIIRNVPQSIRGALKAKAALSGKSMQALILELITRHVAK